MKTSYATVVWIVVVAAAAFLAGFMAHKLQDSLSTPKAPPTYTERLTPLLDLSDEQHQKVIKILEDEDQAIEALLEGEKGAAIRNDIQAIRAEAQNRILQLLDAGQKDRYQQLLGGALPAPGPGK